jgi:hypothetical protein
MRRSPGCEYRERLLYTDALLTKFQIASLAQGSGTSGIAFGHYQVNGAHSRIAGP